MGGPSFGPKVELSGDGTSAAKRGIDPHRGHGGFFKILRDRVKLGAGRVCGQISYFLSDLRELCVNLSSFGEKGRSRVSERSRLCLRKWARETREKTRKN